MAGLRKTYGALKLATVVCALFVLLGTFLFYVFQSGLFRERVRSAIVSSLREATGGEVTLDGFDYDWRTFTARLDRLVIRGAADKRSTPLFTADSVTIQFRVTSFLRRRADLESMRVVAPRVYLLMRPDGTTNIPLVPGRSPIADLLSLRVRHLEFQHGMLLVNEKRIPLDVRADDFDLLLAANRPLTKYAVHLTARSLAADAPWAQSLTPQLAVVADLAKDTLHVRQLDLSTEHSRLEMAGDLIHFLNPQAQFRFRSTLAAGDLGHAIEHALARAVPGLVAGDADLSGTGQYRAASGVSITGTAAIHGLSYRTRAASLEQVQASARFRLSNSGLWLDDLTAAMRGARFKGFAAWPAFRAAVLEGRFGGVELQQAFSRLPFSQLPFSLLDKRVFPWSGIAGGMLRASGDPRKWRSLALESQLQIAPAAGGIPVSGNVSIQRASSGELKFGGSTINLPNTQVSFSGSPNQQVSLTFDTSNVSDVLPALAFVDVSTPAFLPRLQPGGQAHFTGTIAGRFPDVAIAGNVALSRFTFDGQTFDRLRSDLVLSAGSVVFHSLSVDTASLHAGGSGQATMRDWNFDARSGFKLQGQFRGLDLASLRAGFPGLALPLHRGVAAGRLDVSGTLASPLGNGSLTLTHVELGGEEIARVQSDFLLQASEIRVSKGRAESAAGVLQFSGTLYHALGEWNKAQIDLTLGGSGLQLGEFKHVHSFLPGTTAQVDLHGSGTLSVAGQDITLTQLDGNVSVRKIVSQGHALGDISALVVTSGGMVNAALTGDLQKSHLSGSAAVQLVASNPMKGSLQVDRIDLATLYGFLPAATGRPFPFSGYTKGSVNFAGSLEHPDTVKVTVRLDALQLQSAVPVEPADRSTEAIQFQLENSQPIVIDVTDGVARIQKFQLAGSNTALQLTGYAGLSADKPLDIEMHGTIDMQVLQAIDPNVKSTGVAAVNASLCGTVGHAAVGGTLDLKNASFFPRDFPNGLSAVNGSLTFDGERATIQKLTAESGGGQLALTGFVSYVRTGPLVYHLDGRADNVRVRYANGISVTANSDLRLSGTSDSSLLSGSVTVSRVVLNPSTDVGNLLAAFAAPAATPANQKDFLAGLHLDVTVESAPNLQLSTALSRDVEAEIDLRLRGTPDHPVILGSVSANQGDIRVFGTRYSINRGEISFVNTIKIDPVLDLDLQTESRGITVDITISGTINKLNITYRSDPPLQPRDIIALLTVGRAPDVASNIQNVQVANDSSALQSGANTVLGQAISPVSNRLSKLFGITNLKIDPLVQGITNTPQARLTLEQQISRDITVTYITNLSQTSEQIFRVEWAFTRQYSVVALRDENGEFGIDFQYKKRFR